MSEDFVLVFEYRSARRSGIQNWSGPGWYVHAAKNEGEWAIEPRRIDPAVATQLGASFGERVRHLVQQQQDEARNELRVRAARLRAVQEELAEAEADLARYDAEHRPLGETSDPA